MNGALHFHTPLSENTLCAHMRSKCEVFSTEACDSGRTMGLCDVQLLVTGSHLLGNDDIVEKKIGITFL